jgi:RNA 3'-terminal phosphate cyclase
LTEENSDLSGTTTSPEVPTVDFEKNQRMLALANSRLKNLLTDVLRRGYYGRVNVELCVDNGLIEVVHATNSESLK